MDLSLELDGGFVSDGGVFAVGVVVTFDVLEDFDAGVVGVLEASALEHFVFEGADEGFGPGVVVGVGARGHALAEACLGQSVAKWGTAILATAVTVKDGGVGGTGLKGLVEGVEDEGQNNRGQ